MNKRAEEAAMEAYPGEMVTTLARGNKFRAGPIYRSGFVRGYERAAQDLACEVNHAEEAYQNGYLAGLKDRLDWEDVKRIVEIADRLCPFTSKEVAEFQENFQTEEAYYREVLKQYNDEKH